MIPAGGSDYAGAIAAVKMAMTPASRPALEQALAVLEVSTKRSREGAGAAKLGLAVFANALFRYPADVALSVLAGMSETLTFAPALSEVLNACDNAVAPRRELLASLIWSQGKKFKADDGLPEASPSKTWDEVPVLTIAPHPPTRTRESMADRQKEMENGV
jgi:hypothetical protein